MEWNGMEWDELIRDVMYCDGWDGMVYVHVVLANRRRLAINLCFGVSMCCCSVLLMNYCFFLPSTLYFFCF